MNEGWKCPGCSVIYAPFVRSCACQCVPHTASQAVRSNQGVGPILTAEQIKQQAEMNRKAQEARERAMEQAYSDALIYGRGGVTMGGSEGIGQVQHVPAQSMYAQSARPSWLPEGQENC